MLTRRPGLDIQTSYLYLYLYQACIPDPGWLSLSISSQRLRLFSRSAGFPWPKTPTEMYLLQCLCWLVGTPGEYKWYGTWNWVDFHEHWTRKCVIVELGSNGDVMHVRVGVEVWSLYDWEQCGLMCLIAFFSFLEIIFAIWWVFFVYPTIKLTMTSMEL